MSKIRRLVESNGGCVPRPTRGGEAGPELTFDFPIPHQNDGRRLHGCEPEALHSLGHPLVRRGCATLKFEGGLLTFRLQGSRGHRRWKSDRQADQEGQQGEPRRARERRRRRRRPARECASFPRVRWDRTELTPWVARIQRVWILSIDWLTDSIEAGEMLPEEVRPLPTPTGSSRGTLTASAGLRLRVW